MSRQIEQLQILTAEQRELIKKILSENKRLQAETQLLRERLQYLEQQHVVIDQALADVPIDLELIAGEDLVNY